MQEARRLRWIMPALLCLVAFALRLGPLWVNRFHPDEALYSSWALAIAYGRDVLLAHAVLDKPPLPFYLMAVVFFILGRIEIAARLISLMASLVSVALTWQLARKLKISSPSATLALALSPFAILFSSTAFLDPLMVMFVVASLVAGTHKQPGWAGMWLALAATTKVEAFIFLPLVVACGVIAHHACHQDIKLRDLGSKWLGVCARFAAGLALPIIVTLMLERLRGGTLFWINMTINYGGTRPIFASEVMPRLIGWARWLPFLFGWPMLIGLAIGLPLLLIHDLTRGARTRAAVLDFTLVGFTLGYLVLLWLLAIPVWDRYLLGLVPVTSLLVGRLVNWLGHLVTSLPAVVNLSRAKGLCRTEILRRFAAQNDELAEDFRRVPGSWSHSLPITSWIATLAVAALMIYPASQAFKSKLPIGGDHGAQDGIDRVTDYLRSYPYGTVLYDHWLGWSLRYYLWDATPYVAYVATPEWLAADLHVFGRTSPRFIIFPATESTARIERALGAEGFALAPVLSTQNRYGQPTFVLYRIEPFAR